MRSWVNVDKIAFLRHPEICQNRNWVQCVVKKKKKCDGETGLNFKLRLFVDLQKGSSISVGN